MALQKCLVFWAHGWLQASLLKQVLYNLKPPADQWNDDHYAGNIMTGQLLLKFSLWSRVVVCLIRKQVWRNISRTLCFLSSEKNFVGMLVTDSKKLFPTRVMNICRGFAMQLHRWWGWKKDWNTCDDELLGNLIEGIFIRNADDILDLINNIVFGLTQHFPYNYTSDWRISSGQRGKKNKHIYMSWTLILKTSCSITAGARFIILLNNG